MEFLEKLSTHIPGEIKDYGEYIKLADSANNEEEKQALMKIAMEEKQHYMAIKSILESYM